MLKSYGISSNKKNEFLLKFKVEKNVDVKFVEIAGAPNEIHLTYNETAPADSYKRNYKVNGKFEFVFVQKHKAGAKGKDSIVEERRPSGTIKI